jgi:hypothetical protein
MPAKGIEKIINNIIAEHSKSWQRDHYQGSENI